MADEKRIAPGVLGTEFSASQLAMQKRITEAIWERTGSLRGFYRAKSEADRLAFVNDIQTQLRSLVSRDDAASMFTIDVTGGAVPAINATLEEAKRFAGLEAEVIVKAYQQLFGASNKVFENFTEEQARYIADFTTRRYHELFKDFADVSARKAAETKEQNGIWGAVQSFFDWCGAGISYLTAWVTGSLNGRTFDDFYKQEKTETVLDNRLEKVRSVAVKLREELQEMNIQGVEGGKLGAHIAQLITGVDEKGKFVSLPLFVDPKDTSLASLILAARKKENPTLGDRAGDVWKDIAAGKTHTLAGVAITSGLTLMVAPKVVGTPVKLGMAAVEGLVREMGKGYTGHLGGKRLADAVLRVSPNYGRARSMLLETEPDFKRMSEKLPATSRKMVLETMEEMEKSGLIRKTATERIGRGVGKLAGKGLKFLGPLAVLYGGYSYATMRDRILTADDLTEEERESLLRIAGIQSVADIFSIVGDPAMAAYKDWFTDPKLEAKMKKYIDPTLTELVFEANKYKEEISRLVKANRELERYSSKYETTIARIYEGIEKDNGHGLGRLYTQSNRSYATTEAVIKLWASNPDKGIGDFDSEFKPILEAVQREYERQQRTFNKDLTLKEFLQLFIGVNPKSVVFIKDNAIKRIQWDVRGVIDEKLDGMEPDVEKAFMKPKYVKQATLFQDFYNNGLLYNRYLKASLEGGLSLSAFEEQVQNVLTGMIKDYERRGSFNQSADIQGKLAIVGPGLFGGNVGNLVTAPTKAEMERYYELRGKGEEQPGMLDKLHEMMAGHVLKMYEGRKLYDAAHFETSMYRYGSVSLAVAQKSLTDNKPFVEWLEHHGLKDTFSSLLQNESNRASRSRDERPIIAMDSQAHKIILAYMYEVQTNPKWRDRAKEHRETILSGSLDLHEKTSGLLAAYTSRPDAIGNAFALAHMMAAIDPDKIGDISTRLAIKDARALVEAFKKIQQLPDPKLFDEKAHGEFYAAFKKFGESIQQVRGLSKHAALTAPETRQFAAVDPDSLTNADMMAMLKKAGLDGRVLPQGITTAQLQADPAFAKVADVKIVGATDAAHVEAGKRLTPTATAVRSEIVATAPNITTA